MICDADFWSTIINTLGWWCAGLITLILWFK